MAPPDGDAETVALHTTSRSTRVSPLFLTLLVAFAGSGWLTWVGALGWAPFAFVASGWIVSLCLHEYAHAAVAYANGDRSVAHQGYLTLDPRHYADPGLSLFLPLLFLVAGGIGLPGGAVWINRRALRSPAAASLVSAAGPATNAALAVVCLVPIGAGWVPLDEGSLSFAGALAFLGFLQVTAALLNLLPVPGLDGYGMLEPHLPRDLRLRLAPVQRWGAFVLLALLVVPGLSVVLFDTADRVVSLTGVDPALTALGHALFEFWRR